MGLAVGAVLFLLQLTLGLLLYDTITPENGGIGSSLRRTVRRSSRRHPGRREARLWQEREAAAALTVCPAV